MRFVSEAIEPLGSTLSVTDLARAEPSLPEGFRWRDQKRHVAEVLEKSKKMREDMGEMYVGRHVWRLRMDDGAIWNVYFIRHAPRGSGGGAGVPRWFLKTIEGPGPDAGA